MDLMKLVDDVKAAVRRRENSYRNMVEETAAGRPPAPDVIAELIDLSKLTPEEFEADVRATIARSDTEFP